MIYLVLRGYNRPADKPRAAFGVFFYSLDYRLRDFFWLDEGIGEKGVQYVDGDTKA